MAHAPAHAPPALDLIDPHHDLHHGHVIVQPRTLVAVLLTLLVFTVLTVAASRSEVWIAETFHVVVPQIVNVGIVLFIAIIKSALVALYFMQLRYDNMLNGIIFLFCLFALGLFLFFAMLDVGQRGTVYLWKSGEIQKGGQGISTVRKVFGEEIGINTQDKPIVEWARTQRMEALIAKGVADPEAQYLKERALFAEHRENLAPVVLMSTPNRSVPRTGITPDLYKPKEARGPAAAHGR